MSLEIALERIREAKRNNATELDLSDLGLTVIPSELSELTQLTVLNLNGRKHPEIKGLRNLTQLTPFGTNRLTEIKGLENLTQLTHLSLGGNNLTEIKGLENLTQLTTLYLSDNKLTEIRGLENLTQLTTLYLSDNKLTEIRGLENLTQLTTLYLDSNQIIEIKGLDKFTQLRKLNLGSNQIKEIKSIENLTQLRKLNLGSNQIKEIKSVENLTQLTELNLSNNQLAEIKILKQLTQLTDLNINFNNIKDTSDIESIIQNNKLSVLNINGNSLELLTEKIFLFYLQNEFQSESVNKLKNIVVKNQWFEEAAYLRDIERKLSDGSNYLITEEEKIFVETVLLEKIYKTNPIINPPFEIIKQGNKAIQEYFDQRKRSGEELLNEAKLILLGDGRSGKTSLANRLLNKELPKQADRTQGVDIVIGEYSFPLANGKDFKINIWDFAGQDKYKTLHQLFYTDSSLYVMVAEAGKATTDYDDWFQTAELFGEGSPLVLVLNEFKAGIGAGSFDTNYWKKRFPELLKEVFTVNLGTKDNFAAAEEYIRLLAQTLPHTKYAFPSNWAAIRRVLNERRNEQFISQQEYFQICKDNGLPERESALVLSSVLHKIGDCLHYQKSELLRQYVILKNEWATDAVYKILDDKIVAEQKCGFFDRADTERIWDSEQYRDMRPQLLELMKQFKLAYQLPGKEEYVTPPLLAPASPAGYAWPGGDSLELYIDYEFLPKALLTQFIVTRHADIAEGRTQVWRHGVILKWEGEALAEVTKTKLDGKDAFHIRTQGHNRKEMMTVILKTFRELHAEYKGIKYKEKVPCTCEGCRTGKNEQHYFDFVNLQNRLAKRRYEVECDKSLETLNVLELLENTFVFEKYKEGQTLQLKDKVPGESAAEMRILNLFLASSNELIGERERIEQALSRKNKALRKQGFLIELLIWEDGKHIGTSLRSQDKYNLDVEQCNFFAMLFHSKVGKYTLEEYELAKSLFDKKSMPRICIFQKDKDLPKNQGETDAKSRFGFLNQLKELEHFPILFDNTDKLTNELEGAIDKLLQDEAFVKELKVE